MIRRALSLALVLALVLVPATVAAKRGKPVTATLTAASLTVSPDPILAGPYSVTVTADDYGWLRLFTPCVQGWVSVGPGTSTISLYSSEGCAGDYTFWVTDTAGLDVAGPFTFVGQ